MARYKSIVICGKIASGTSTAAINVSKKLNLKYESAGDFFRKYTLEKKVPLHDKSQIPDDLDRQIDTKLTNMTESGGYVIDSHYAAYFARNNKHVLKILLECSDKERFKRALLRKHTHSETVEEIKLREKGIQERFNKLYSSEDFENPKFFDLVIDTTKTNPKTTAQKIIEKFNS